MYIHGIESWTFTELLATFN